jgi:hypothetical protein
MTAEAPSPREVADPPTRERARAVCREALAWAAERDYAGWDPYDGLNARAFDPLDALPEWLPGTGLLRLVAMHGVHKSPVNLRPLLGVPRERNPKGVALFALAYLDRYEREREPESLERAESLLGWLRANDSPSFEEPCWGYNFGWQNGRKFHLPAGEPSIVVSVFCGRAFLRHHALTRDPESLRTAERTAAFVRERINTREVDGRTVYTYSPYDSFVVVNANALAAAFLAGVGTAAGDDDLTARATELVDFVVDAQTDEGAWYYAVPAEESHLSHDNFHTGFVLESLHRYLTTTGDHPAAVRAYRRGMEFYRSNLFEADGAPRFEADSPYPRDAHSAAQGIRTLVLDGDLATAESVLRWTLRNLYDEAGYFYRRRGRVLSDTTPYMRWSQAWLCYALGTYLRAAGEGEAGG